MVHEGFIFSLPSYVSYYVIFHQSVPLSILFPPVVIKIKKLFGY